jgi:hypothetical protein
MFGDCNQAAHKFLSFARCTSRALPMLAPRYASSNTEYDSLDLTSRSSCRSGGFRVFAGSLLYHAQQRLVNTRVELPPDVDAQMLERRERRHRIPISAF